jgi:hypothetical protein
MDLCPSTVAVHDDGNVFRYVIVKVHALKEFQTVSEESAFASKGGVKI